MQFLKHQKLKHMEYTRLGNTGLKVSRICLGTMTYGTPNDRWQWALNEDERNQLEALYLPHQVSGHL